MTPNQTAPLWQLLGGAADVLLAVRAGRTTAVALRSITPTLQPGVQALAFDVLRQLGRAEWLRAQLARRAPPPAADALLCCVLALLVSDGPQRYDVHTLVDQAVEAAKRRADARAQSAFLNACLRRFLRERDALLTAASADPVARYNHPRWWIDRVRAEHPQDWARLLEADNVHPPLTLRVNVRRTSVADYLEQLQQAGLAARQVGETAVWLEQPLPVQRIPGFADGLCSVQDAAAQLAAPLLLKNIGTASAGMPHRLRVLDACAAPGGKTAHLLESADCDVTALDVDPARCERVEATLARLGLQANVLAGDALQPAQSWFEAAGGKPFDAILLDAPCTASGIARRQPDVRWLRRPTDIAQLARTQVRAAAGALAVGCGRRPIALCDVFDLSCRGRRPDRRVHCEPARRAQAPRARPTVAGRPSRPAAGPAQWRRWTRWLFLCAARKVGCRLLSARAVPNGRARRGHRAAGRSGFWRCSQPFCCCWPRRMPSPRPKSPRCSWTATRKACS